MQEPGNIKGAITFSEKISVGETLVVAGKNLENLLLWKTRPGAAVTVSDNNGRLFRARVGKPDKNGRYSLLIFEDTGFEKTHLFITLLQALPEKERMELIIQKTTELGVGRIAPFESEKSISLEQRESKQKKAHKWEEIALRAAKQSRRESIPDVLPCSSFKEALGLPSRTAGWPSWPAGKAEESGLRIMLAESNGPAGGPSGTAGRLDDLKGFLRGKNVSKVAILVGPEGGFGQDEVEEAQKNGFIPITLGGRILRTETAAIIGVGLVRYELGW
ncbi:MAG: 16S rRNA (uracil(1498)-N(3))-methyltransferase [Deltaproteobacteria bacterium]|nr:16S rRNA (uracil(1498)-N(3))-methyltransferase [Deltaproteobacteria bacterium]